jgi:hypothetical protein
MAHYAEINDDNVVVNIFVGKNEDDTLPDGVASWEEYYTNNEGIKVKRYSYNTKFGIHYTENDNGIPVVSEDQSKAFRGNLPNVGSLWSEEHEIFYHPKDTDKASWTLNTTTGEWEAPIAKPADSDVQDYYWKEELYQSDNTRGWLPYPG